MATIFTHAAVAAVIKSNFKPFPNQNGRILFWSLFLCILPDADILAFVYGIPYEDLLGHRGFTHSLLFLFIISPLISFLIFKKESRPVKIKLALLFCLCLFSHGFLDALTNGGLGIGFFIPFDNTRYFFPWTPIEVSPIGRNFFSMNGVDTLLSEAKVVVTPLVVFLFSKYLIRRFKK